MEDINIDDDIIYHIWYALYNGTVKNDIVKNYIENSPNNLTREEFFTFLWNNKQMHNIYNLLDLLLKKYLYFEMASFSNQMVEWYNNKIDQNKLKVI